MGKLTQAKKRALRLAAEEGSLVPHRGRWAPPSRVAGLAPTDAVTSPFERSATVFALEYMRLLMPDPQQQRGEVGDGLLGDGRHPRPRLITDAGRDVLRDLSGPKRPIGLTDKLYWRTVGSDTWHCFKRLHGCGRNLRFVSLCGKWERKSSGGQECRRPRPEVRCGWCDGAEITRRGWEESGPESGPEEAGSNG